MKWGFLLCFFFAVSLVQAQTYSDGWGLGLGMTSPRMFGDTYAEKMDFGGHLFLIRDFDEVNSLRLRLDYLHFTSNGSLQTPPVNPGPSNTTIAVGFDYLYTISACNPVKVFAGAGASALAFKIKDGQARIGTKENLGEIAVNIIVGAKVPLSPDFDFRVEAGIHQVSTDRFDGLYGPGGGLFGGNLDSYLTGEIGITYYVDRGPETKYCEASGITKSAADKNNLDYARIEAIVKKYAQPGTEVDYNRIEDIVKRNAPQAASADQRLLSNGKPANNWVLIGINFDAGKSTFRPEAFPLLINAVQILLSNPGIKIQIEGHTDNVGSAAANQKLSEQRAQAVKRFLVVKGVDESRISTVGYGASKPISDNKTAQGKAFNRRIEFKVLD
jgi:outer membrane protein OmpA-like peptidoglycan-associated protein